MTSFNNNPIRAFIEHVTECVPDENSTANFIANFEASFTMLRHFKTFPTETESP